MFDQFLTIEELEANTQHLVGDSRVAITPLGVSRLGRPIEMISVGQGARNALVVGVPHPNEPAGAITVERMIELLLRDPSEARGYRWHFIKAIDPEGLRLNGGWLRQPRTLTHYLENFFRPSLERQPETTFPLDIPDVRFSASTPENKAWQRAFELTRPALHASLHHLDFGGVYYSLNRTLPEAISGLEAAIKAAGLCVNDLHDPVMTPERWSPAVSRYPTVLETTTRAKEYGAAWAWPWTVGDMSPGYAETRFGTFSLVAEVPMWNAESLEDTSPSGVSCGDQYRALRTISDEARAFAVRHVGRFDERTLGADAKECLWALQAGLKMLPASAAQALPDDARMLSRHEFEIRHTQQVLFSLRTYGLLIRLAALVLERDPTAAAPLNTWQEAKKVLHREIDAIEARTNMTPVPVRVMTGVQMAAIFICADALNAQA